MFNYGEQIYPAFSGNDRLHYDKMAESLATSAVQKYFYIARGNAHYQLFISGDEMAYNFIANGINELSKTMELYISDKFRRMAVRPQ